MSILSLKGYNLYLEKKHLLKDITIDINDGERIGIIGKNGSGKTLLLRSIAGIYDYKNELKMIENFHFLSNPSTGILPLLKPKEACRRILALNNQSNFDQNYFNQLMELFDLVRFENFYFKNLSQGYKLRFQIVIFLISNCSNLIIDEFIGYGDKFVRENLIEIIDNKFRKLNTLIVATHNWDLIKKFCNRVIHIDEGKIIRDYKL